MIGTRIPPTACCAWGRPLARRSGSIYPVALSALALGVVGAIALLTPRKASAKGTAKLPKTPDKPARLTEYYPDLPSSASKEERRREGGANARDPSIPVITLDQHRADPVRYPFATVAADIQLGRTIRKGFGPRVYFAAFPKDTFRIYDTGGNFTGDGKKPGLGEPFDIALSYSGPLRGTIGRTLTTYTVDFEDTLPFPERLRIRRDA